MQVSSDIGQDLGKENRFVLAFNIIKLSLRNTRRNPRRSLILATGLILSIAILSGTFSYVDTSSAALISRSMDNLPVDFSMNFLNRSATAENVSEVLTSLESLPEIDLFESVDPIIGGFPFTLSFRYGFAISSDSNYELNTYHPDAEGSYDSAFAFGLTEKYLNRRNSPFSATIDTDINSISMNEILVSKTLAVRNDWKIGDTVNISYAYGEATPNLRIIMGNSMNLTISGFVDVDLGMMVGNLKAYVPEVDLDDDLVSLISFQSFSADMFFINWENMIEFTSSHGNMMRFIHGIHMSLDPEKLGSEVEVVEAQLLNVEIKIASQFPDLIVNNFAYEELQKIEERLIGYRLFILYFSLPGILLGFVFTLYVNELTLEQRKKEIGILRLRNTHTSVIQYIVGLEVFIISLIGTIIGFVIGTGTGYILSKMEVLQNYSLNSINSIFKGLGESDLSYNEMVENLSSDSIASSIFIGLLLSSLLTFLFIRKISKLRLYQEIQRSDIRTDPLWKRYYIDIAIISLVLLVQILSGVGFNPIPSFAQALYDLIVPLFSWIGYTLVGLRMIIWMLSKLNKIILRVFRKFIGSPGIAVARSLIRNRYKLSSPILVLLLSMSLIFTVANISTTFNNQAELESAYAVGADIRIQFPALDQLEFKTSDFAEKINNIPGLHSTEIFITLFDFGNRLSLAIVMDPIEFLEVAYFRDDFFYYDSPQESLTALGESEGGLGMILSFNLGFPFADSPTDISKGPPSFDQNDTIPFTRFREEYEIPIFDIAVRFPGLSDLVGRPSEDLPYVLMNHKFFTEPLPGQDEAISEAVLNATHMFIDVDESILSVNEAKEKVLEVYDGFDASYVLGIRTIDDYSEEFFELGDLLLGLTQLEFIAITLLLLLTEYLYVLSELDKKEKEYAILMGMGWRSKTIQHFITSQIVFISTFSIIISLIFAPFVTAAYIPLLSTLFLFEIEATILSTTAMIIGSVIVILSSLISIVHGFSKTSKTNIAEALRGI